MMMLQGIKGELKEGLEGIEGIEGIENKKKKLERYGQHDGEYSRCWRIAMYLYTYRENLSELFPTLVRWKFIFLSLNCNPWISRFLFENFVSVNWIFVFLPVDNCWISPHNIYRYICMHRVEWPSRKTQRKIVRSICVTLVSSGLKRTRILWWQWRRWSGTDARVMRVKRGQGNTRLKTREGGFHIYIEEEI